MRILLCTLALGCLLVPARSQRGNRGKGGATPFTTFHKLEHLSVGKAAPRLHAKDSAGDEMDLRDYLGRWVFIEFGSYT